MVTYSLLSRKMNNEIRLSYKKSLVIGFSFVVLFIYALTKTSCDPQPSSKLESSGGPIIYAVTPTYNRPVQKAELTRWKKCFNVSNVLLA